MSSSFSEDEDLFKSDRSTIDGISEGDELLKFVKLHSRSDTDIDFGLTTPISGSRSWIPEYSNTICVQFDRLRHQPSDQLGRWMTSLSQSLCSLTQSATEQTRRCANTIKKRLGCIGKELEEIEGTNTDKNSLVINCSESNSSIQKEGLESYEDDQEVIDPMKDFNEYIEKTATEYERRYTKEYSQGFSKSGEEMDTEVKMQNSVPQQQPVSSQESKYSGISYFSTKTSSLDDSLRIPSSNISLKATTLSSIYKKA